MALNRKHDSIKHLAKAEQIFEQDIYSSGERFWYGAELMQTQAAIYSYLDDRKAISDMWSRQLRLLPDLNTLAESRSWGLADSSKQKSHTLAHDQRTQQAFMRMIRLGISERNFVHANQFLQRYLEMLIAYRPLTVRCVLEELRRVSMQPEIPPSSKSLLNKIFALQT